MWVWMKKDEAYVAPEFEYEKLAKEIIKAQREAAKKDNELDDTADAMRLFLVVEFALIAVAFFAVAGYGVHELIKLPTTGEKFTAFVAILSSIMCGITSGWFALKIRKINDKVYMVNFFSAIVALTALLVTLLK